MPQTRKPETGKKHREKMPAGGTDSTDIQGEGNYEAAREYNADQQEFVRSGKVEKAARDAAPRSSKEESEMLDAERKGRRRAKK